jgi:Xaa-Pro aminopeptidase
MSLSGARVGIETDHLAASDLLALGAALPRAEFVPAEGLFARARAIKTGREIELMRRTAGMADEAAAAALAMCRAGIAEFEIAAEITRSLYRRGAEGISSLMVASGPPGSRMTPVPGGRVVERGDEVRIELAPRLEGYHATVRRTGLVGRTAPGGATGTRAAQAWSSLAGMIGPGAAGRDIARAHLKAIAPFEAPPKLTLGHGIGLGPREPPLLGAGGAAVLEEGMVLVLEPLVHDRRRGFDLPAKEMVLVTASGAENLTAERAGMPAQDAEDG